MTVWISIATAFGTCHIYVCKAVRDGERQSIQSELETFRKLAEQMNTADYNADEQIQELQKYKDKRHFGFPFGTEEEFRFLSIQKGTLSDEERKIMKDYIVETDDLLSQMYFSSDYSHVREYAASHHELLDGSGYPKGLSGDEIPALVRIMTILDIYDALTADDRPYKKPKTQKQAFAILNSMANAGKLDKELLTQFITFLETPEEERFRTSFTMSK